MDVVATSRANNPLKYSISAPSSTMFQSHRCFSFFSSLSLSLSLLLMNYFLYYSFEKSFFFLSSKMRFQISTISFSLFHRDTMVESSI